ncbi:pyrroline-5-carboxylate reductase [Haloferula sp.]|uniref:pyrroline-5-carboxylate reductase n=1 Tax=Haloferula sp. TaxID=2497595 RepID=UPI0032A081C0
MKLGVIGCGKMGSALIGGAIRAKAIDTSQIIGFDPFPAAGEAFTAATGSPVTSSLTDLADCDTFLLATKPQQAAEALESLKNSGVRDATLVSIAAGLTIDWLENHSPEGFRIVRSMPNTPALVGKGASAYARSSHATPEDAAFADKLLGSVGLAVEVPESMLDAVTGLSGSGPAYIYLAIEALTDGGVEVGLPREQAHQLAAQTVLGAAAMVLETGTPPAELRSNVTSPGGTTVAGLTSLEETGFRASLISAVAAATARAAELGKG